MIETVLLTVVGGLLGLAVAAWGTRLLEVLGADRLPLGAHIAFDGWLAAIGLVGSVVLGIVIAVPIAWFNLSSSSGARAPIRIAHRHDQSRRATASPRIHRRADRARLRSAGGRGAARAEPEKSDGGFSRFPGRSCAHRANSRSRGSYPNVRAVILDRLLESIRSATGSRRQPERSRTCR